MKFGDRLFRIFWWHSGTWIYENFYNNCDGYFRLYDGVKNIWKFQSRSQGPPQTHICVCMHNFHIKYFIYFDRQIFLESNLHTIRYKDTQRHFHIYWIYIESSFALKFRWFSIFYKAYYYVSKKNLYIVEKFMKERKFLFSHS